MTDKIGQFDGVTICGLDTQKEDLPDVGSLHSTSTQPERDVSIPSKIEEFFHDDPNLPRVGLPEHSLEESPCYHLIKSMGRTIYKCKLHPELLFIDLAGIEHHCKYKEPYLHRSEAIRLATREEKSA